MSVVIDASVWVSSSRSDERGYDASLAFIHHVRQKHVEVFCPWLVLAECASAIFRATDSLDVVDQLLSRIERFPGLTLVNVDEKLAHEAVNIIAKSGLRGADSIYAALARIYGATVVAWDKAFLTSELKEEINAVDPLQWLAANA